MSTCRYGDGTLYGASGVTYGTNTVSRSITWGVTVDWDEDGSFSGENEAAYLVSGTNIKGRLLNITDRMGREFVFNSSADGFVNPSIGDLQMEFLNNDGRYDPYNEDSPLADYLYKNQKVLVVVKDETTGTRYTHFTGRIRDIKPSYGEINTATIYVDGADIDLNVNIKSSEVYEGVQFQDQITQALTDAGWTGDTDIDDTVTETMAYHWFRGNYALTEIYELADASFGLFWVNEEGTAVFKSRINSDVSTQTITEADIDYQYKIQTPSPREILRNKIRVYAKARALQSDVEIWRLTDKPQITGTGNPIWANFNYNGQEVPALAVTSPVTTTDYTANDAIDGSGTNRTGNFSFALTTFATSARLIPTNSGGAAYITLLKLRGDVITTDDYTYVESENASSITAYGEREFVLRTNWLQNLNSAQEIAETLEAKFATPKVFPRFKYKRSAIGKMYTTNLFQLITVNFSEHNITGEFRLGYRERSWNINEPSVIDTVVYLEPNLTVASAETWVFPTTFPTVFE